jgi:hypothetical protein
MALTSPITLATAGVDGEAPGVCPAATKLKVSTEITAKMNIVSLFTPVVSLDLKLTIIYASVRVIVAKL